MTRVLHVYAGNLYGGVESMLAALARAPGLDAHFALSWPAGRLGQELSALDPARVHPLGAVRLRNPLSVLRARAALRSLAAELGPEVMVCHSAWAQAVFGPVAARAGLPLVFWLHDAAGDTLVERLAGRVRPHAAVCTSRYVATTLPGLYPDLPAEVIHPAVPAPDPEAREAGERLRMEAEVDDEEVVFIQVARMEPWKGHAVLLDALARLRDLSDWRCWMVGGAQRPEEARYLEQLRGRAAELGIAERVAWLGERRDVAALLAAADVCVQPNAAPEPFGIAMVEALYAGLPVVAADHGGAREVVERGCGVRFRPGDSHALADALRALLGPDLRARLGERGPARAAALSDPAARVEQLAALLATVARRAPAATALPAGIP